MGSPDCIDICDAIIEIMCWKCPNYKKCQNAEDEANHDQMFDCIGHLKFNGPYPKEFVPCVDEEDEYDDEDGCNEE